MLLPSIHVGVQTLRANPVRTLLSTLGIVMGAASLVGVLAIGDGIQGYARLQIERFGLQAISIAPKTSETVDGIAIPRTGYPIFTVDNMNALKSRLMPGSAVAMAADGMGTFVAKPGGAPRAASVASVLGSPDAVGGGIGIAHGRFLTDAEMSSGAPAVVISNKLAVELAAGRDVATLVGATLTLQGSPWTIVGVLEPFPADRVFRVLAPLAAESRATMPSASPLPRGILIKAPRVEDVLAVRTQVEAWADATDPRWRSESRITINATGRERLDQLNQGTMLFKLMMGAFTSISLIVGGIGIMNVLLAAVAERTREIGVRKASGANRRDIVTQFLAESVMISLAGAVLGAVLGIGGAFLFTAFMRSRTGAPVQAALTLSTMAISMGAAIGVGLVFGIYPALKAARLSPIDAMRYE